MTQHQQLHHLLRQIEQELQALQLWQQVAPSREALGSTEPFCVDTLSFCEWLQWIMLPRFDDMIRQQQPLPGSSDIAAMAEEAFKGVSADTSTLLGLMHQVDSTLRRVH
ncbi:YqcC family protein [Marinobacterium rhizophilum]|uniref:YqcC family protein n=1 Tax=Marinobacterium rhizophilum TaxID=420402 RepID=A0ABY5HNE1_9GAMM|nr:YqcC family protein [Marinobacterium rhizophilum]UTW13948.1 YqcC family protein [Marinobacterium rhizophilum]